MLIVGLVVAAIVGPLYVWRTSKIPTARRYGIASAVSVGGAAVTPIAMGQCGFAADTSGVDHLLAYGLMAVGAALALIAARSFFDKADGQDTTSGFVSGEIRTGGFRMGWWVPWVLLSPTLIILIVFLYTPAARTFTLAGKLAKMAAPPLGRCLLWQLHRTTDY